EDGIRDGHVTGVQTCALPICSTGSFRPAAGNLYLHRYCSFAESLSETAPNSLRHSCGSELARQGISLIVLLAIALVIADHKRTRSEERRVGKEWTPASGRTHW